MTSKLDIPIYTLNNGVKMPGIGLGCWSGTTPEQQNAGQAWMETALQNGYRHMDTAYGYGTEHCVGNAIRKVGIPREEVFVTTKLPNHHHGLVAKSLEISLKRAGFDYYDLYLVHWPQAYKYKGEDDTDPRLPDGHYEVADPPGIKETWAQMEQVLETGKARAIGVSNFSIKTLTELLEHAKIVPAVNQVEMHPHQNQKELKEFCDRHGIRLTAYSPTGYSHVANDPVVVEVAKKYNVVPAQAVLAWHLARGTAAVPKSSSSKHQVENLTLPVLEQEDIDKLNSLHKNIHYCDYGEPRDRVFGWTYEQMGW